MRELRFNCSTAEQFFPKDRHWASPFDSFRLMRSSNVSADALADVLTFISTLQALH